MQFLAQFAHAGHTHEEITLTADTATLIIFGIIAVSVVIAAVTMIVLNRHRKKTTTGPGADSE